jgi:ferritin-like metal-binding protein YciE
MTPSGFDCSGFVHFLLKKMNFPEIEKEYRIRQLETEKEIRPVQDVVNSLYKEKKIVCDKIEKEKGTIESIREKSKNNFAKFLNELNLGKEN